MKCPNCSFINPDNSSTCRVCGYEFTPLPERKISKSKSSLDENDDEMDITFDTLFGVPSNPRTMKNPLDKSKDKSRLLNEDKEEHQYQDQFPNEEIEEYVTNNDISEDTQIYEKIEEADSAEETEEADSSEEMEEAQAVEDKIEEIETGQTEFDVIDIELIEHEDETAIENGKSLKTKKTRNNRFTLFLLISLLILILALTYAGSKILDFKNQASDNVLPEENASVTENTAPVTTETENDITEEDVIKLFFDEYPSYVNDGNISLLMKFNNPQSILEKLNLQKSLGLEEIIFEISEIKSESESVSFVDAIVTIKRFNIPNVEEIWQFKLSKADNKWSIDDIVFPIENTAKDTNPQESKEPPKSTTTTTPVEKPTGFISSGNFKGGIVTDGQNISQIRLGNHDLYERIVIDFSVPNNDGILQPVSEVCKYEAKISADGRQVEILMFGVRGASATSPDFTYSKVFKSIDIFYPKDDSTVGLTLILREKSSFKVFPLKEPGRIVIDVMKE